MKWLSNKQILSCEVDEPWYYRWILEAIIELKEPDGSSLSAIKDYLEGSSKAHEFKVDPDFLRNGIKAALVYGIHSGHLVTLRKECQHGWERSYRLIFGEKSVENKLPVSSAQTLGMKYRLYRERLFKENQTMMQVMCDSDGADEGISDPYDFSVFHEGVSNHSKILSWLYEHDIY